MVQTGAVVLWLFGESPAGRPRARAHLARAQRAALPATARERQLASAVAQWLAGEVHEAIAGFETIAR